MIELFSGDEYLELDLNRVKEPTIGYVYYLFYKEQLVYIGSSISIDNRISSHKSVKLFDRVLYREVDYTLMLELETSEIKKYYPIYNTKDIVRADWSKEECSMMLEFDNYYIIRTVGHIPKDHVFIKGDNVVILDHYKYGNGINIRYKTLNLKTLTFQKKELWKKKDHKYHFCIEKFDFVAEYIAPEPEPVKKKFYGNKNKIKPRTTPVSISHSIPDDYSFPVGKYKGILSKHVKDDGYKNWFWENVYHKRK